MVYVVNAMQRWKKESVFLIQTKWVFEWFELVSNVALH